MKVPTPQRAPVFNALAEAGLDFLVVYLAPQSVKHGWGELKVTHRHVFVDGGWRNAICLAWRILCSREIRVVAPFGYRGPLRILALFVARVRRLQVLTRSDSNVTALVHDNTWKLRARRHLFRAIYPKSTRVWTIGSENARFWEEYIGRPNTILIPYSTPSLPNSLGVLIEPRISDPAHLRFLFVGRLVSLKSISTLLNAFMSLKEPKYSGWTLDVVGGGPLSAELELLAASDRRIRFRGPCPYEELDVYYLNSDVFVLPSEREAWGLVTNEALGFGLWVIVSDQVGSSQLITDISLGKKFSSRNVDALAECLVDAANHCERRPIAPTDPTPAMLQDLRELTVRHR